MLSVDKMQMIVEAALMCAHRPLSLTVLRNLFRETPPLPDSSILHRILQQIADRHVNSGIELQVVTGGYRLQSKAVLSPWLSQLWEERPTRYSPALLETLAIIAYKQPITRAEIEVIRGVGIRSALLKTLQEREWIRALGQRDLPGKPILYGTTDTFLNDFNLRSLAELPPLLISAAIEPIPL